MVKRRCWVALSALSAIACAASVAAAVCGDGVVELSIGEECDDGGICIGGSNAGDACDSEGFCVGNGVCVGGAKIASACAADADCPGSSCVHCKPFGGDGCAANCTLERDLAFELVPGVVFDINIARGTSGAVVHGDGQTLPLPFMGNQVLTAGKERDGQVPGTIKAQSVQLPRIEVGGLACACVRSVAAKTCGGTLFEIDGVTLAANCSDGFTAGPSVCPPDKPCAFVHGPGNTAAGLIGCEGLEPVDLDFTQDCGLNAPLNPAITLSNSGPAGSALIVTSSSIGIVIGACSGTTAEYGADGEFCTDDDPQSARGEAVTLPATTGNAVGLVTNANDFAGTVGPFASSGEPFSCSMLAAGDTSGTVLVGALTLCDQNFVGDVVVRNLFSSRGGTPPPTMTPASTPTPSPTTPPRPCVGDCDGSGQVTVDEILVMVNIALGAPSSMCTAGDANGDGMVTVDEILSAVSAALNGCP